jgi:hypothetical protein
VTAQNGRKLPEPAKGVTSRELDDEFVVLSAVTNQVHALNGPVAAVWRSALDGSWPTLPDEEVTEAVQALLDLDLLAPPTGMSRRSVLKAGGAVAIASGIVSIGLPLAAAAASPGTTVSTGVAGSHTLTALPHVTSITFTLVGAGGGAGDSGATLSAPTISSIVAAAGGALTVSTEYWYKVTAINAAGETIASAANHGHWDYQVADRHLGGGDGCDGLQHLPQ